MNKQNSNKQNSNGRISITLGFPWFSLWLFTTAVAHLSLGQSVLALVVWPYYLGDAVAAIAGR
jgi:hypothetical protein